MINPFVHVELHTQDPEKAKKFYKELFDWKFEDVPDKDYTVINVGEGTGGGIMKCPMPPDARPQWVPYTQPRGAWDNEPAEHPGVQPT